jgi:hypothetical protein
LLTQTDSLSLNLKRLLPRFKRPVEEFLLLCSELLLFPSKAVVLGLEAGQVALSAKTVILLVTLIAGRKYAKETLRGIKRTRTHGKKPLSKNTVGLPMTTDNIRSTVAG